MKKKLNFKLGFLNAIFAVVCAAYNPAPANSAPKACTWAANDPDLDVSDAEVASSDLLFTHKGTNFQAQIRGAIVVDPTLQGPPYRICRRYEFTNLSNGIIKELRWPDVGFGLISEINPNESIRLPRHLMHNTKTFQKSSTDLYAWENNRVNGVTVFPANISPRKASVFGPEPGKMYSVKAANYQNALTDIQPKGMLLEARYAFFTPPKFIELPALRSGFNSPIVTVNINSSASFSPRDYVVSSLVKLDYRWNREGKATIYAPGIASLSKLSYTSGSGANETLRALAKLANNNASISVKSGSSISFDLGYKLAKENNDPTLYVVEQPITLRIGDWSACLLASVYAPVPISFDSDVHCEASK